MCCVFCCVFCCAASEHRNMMKQKKKIEKEIRLNNMRHVGDTPTIWDDQNLFNLRSLRSAVVSGHYTLYNIQLCCTHLEICAIWRPWNFRSVWESFLHFVNAEICCAIGESAPHHGNLTNNNCNETFLWLGHHCNSSSRTKEDGIQLRHWPSACFLFPPQFIFLGCWFGESFLKSHELNYQNKSLAFCLDRPNDSKLTGWLLCTWRERKS